MAAGRKQQRVINGAAVVAVVALLVVAADAVRICNVDMSAVKTCDSYVKNGSPERRPSQSCCNATRGVRIKCACGYKNYVPKGYSAKRAMEIPAKCGFGPSNPCG